MQLKYKPTFLEGTQGWINGFKQDKNPYMPDSNEWKAWRYGWRFCKNNYYSDTLVNRFRSLLLRWNGPAEYEFTLHKIMTYDTFSIQFLIPDKKFECIYKYTEKNYAIDRILDNLGTISIVILGVFLGVSSRILMDMYL